MPRTVQWVLLAGASALLGALLEYLHMPAALLLGPMIAGIVFGLRGASIRVGTPVFQASQGVVGCLVAVSLSADSLPAFEHDLPLLAAIVLVTLSGSSFLGYLIARLRILPGTVGVWGSTPGAASAMVLMAGAFGADQRLVAFMQYFRVILVTATAALVAHFTVGETGAAPAIDWLPALDPLRFGAAIVVIASGPLAARLLRQPLLCLVVPMILGAALKFSGLVVPQLPVWLLAPSYAVIGWSIGLKFTRETIMQVWRALPFVTVSIAALILFCAAIAFGLSRLTGIDPLTAYLATSPGGIDSVAIIAAASARVDISFVMAMQLLRFVIVLLLGPPLARFVARRIERR